MSIRCIIALVFLSAGLNAQILPPLAGNHSISSDTYWPDHGEQQMFPDLPQKASPRPMAGVVSLHDLEHPIPEKALRAAFEGQRLARANKTMKAIKKLEQAVRIAPRYRDAHNDLGVQYAVLLRFADARAEFQKALEIGPPAEPIYLNLALSCAAVGDSAQASVFARKTLDLDPHNAVALKLLESSSAH